MAYLAQKHEQKAQRPIYQEAYQYYLDLYAEKQTSSFRIIKDIWEDIPQNNTRDKPLTESQLKLVAIIYALIEKSDNRFTYFSLDFLCKKLKITDRQLRTVRKAISHIFHSKWRKAIKIKGIRRENIYVFSYTCRGKIILEATDKYYKSIKLGSTLPTSYNEYENNKKNIDHKSNSFLISKEITTKENTTSEIVLFPKEPVKTVKLKKLLANERKKPTKAERKARIYHFNQYKEPKDLGYHYPLTKDDGDKLQRLSGRDFRLNAMNEILLDMSKRRDNRFCSKAQFMAYFGKCLRFEMRDAVKTSNDNFYVKANVTPINQKEITKAKQIEQYLAEVEQKAITHVCPDNQLKARLANTLEPLRSYELLSHIKDFAVIGSIVRIYLRAECELSEHEQNVILTQVQSIYSSPDIEIESVEYLVENSYQQVNGYDEVRTKGTPVMPTLQQGIWGDICRKLIETSGIHVYNNWFSKLTPVIDEQNRTIELKAPNLFVKQWVEMNYGDGIRNIVKKLGLEFRELPNSSNLRRGLNE